MLYSKILKSKIGETRKRQTLKYITIDSTVLTTYTYVTRFKVKNSAFYQHKFFVILMKNSNFSARADWVCYYKLILFCIRYEHPAFLFIIGTYLHVCINFSPRNFQSVLKSVCLSVAFHYVRIEE